MKIRSSVKGEISVTKNIKKTIKKQKKKKHVKIQKSRIFHEAKFDSSSDESSHASVHDFRNQITNLDVQKPSTSNESNFTISLTPSKSEYGVNERSASDTHKNDISCSLTEESFEISSPESDSFCYNNIYDEFVTQVIDKDDNGNNAKIVSSPISNQKNSENPSKTSNEKPEPKAKIKSKPQIDEHSAASREPSSANVSFEDAHCYYSNDGIIVILEKNQTIYFHGLMLLAVLHGEVEILGHTVNKNNHDVKLYSLRGTSLLYMTNVTTSDVPVANYLMNLNNLNKIKLSDKCAIVICKKLEDSSISFIEKHMSQQILPKDDPNNPRVVFQPKGSWNLLKPHQNWNSIINGIHMSTKMMICGGKGVGKTTFLRYAINKLLMKFNKVRIIDLDPGQSEFTMPGCISVVKVDAPVFGVNYTHLKSAERSILSNINIAYEPDKYIASVKHLLDTIDSDAIPTLINYMGYTHGIGINILSAAIIHVQPTDILQIQSLNPKKNYKYKLNLQAVAENAELFIHPVSVNFDYNLHEIFSMCDENNGWTAEPRQLREMSTLAHISQMIHSNTIFRTKLPMYKIDLSAVCISDLKGEIIHPASVNACLVALCSLEEKTPHNIFRCLSWGIVRGIDLASNTLVLLTSEELQMLEQVSYIVLSSVSLPPSLYMTPDEVTGQMPYVIEGVLMSLGQIPKRSRISVKSTT